MISHLHNNKKQTFAGLPYIDFGARLYDPATARWLRTDIFSASTSDISPYSFCAGDPVNLIDPWGLSSYLVNGEAFGIDDGDDSFSMDVTERQYERLFRKFNNNMLSYARYRNRLSRQNGYNTLATTSENATGNGEIAGSVITAHSPGASYLDYQASGAWLSTVSGVIGTGAGIVNNETVTDRIRIGSNDQWYFLKKSDRPFYSNQYVTTQTFAQKYSKIVKGAEAAGSVLTVADFVVSTGNVYLYEGQFGINTMLLATAKVSGAAAGYALGRVCSAIGVGIGLSASPIGAVIAGSVCGAVGSYVGSTLTEKCKKQVFDLQFSEKLDSAYFGKQVLHILIYRAEMRQRAAASLPGA